MENFLKNKRFFCILLLICLAGFLILPNISLANDFDDITLREAAKHLELSTGKVQDLIQSFINIFHSEWMDLVGSGYVSAEKMAVPSIMKKAVQVQALNHLLIDAPIQTTLAIIKSATKIARVFLIKDISGVLDELEKESVKKAVAYGMSVLLENEIRMSPGAIEFEYKLREGGTGKVLIQYIMIYKPLGAKNGEMVVKFHSTESLKPPKNEGSIGGKLGTYTELERDLPPFIVDIRGTVEDYRWVESPSIEIDFPAEVPDLGIRPLSKWEKFVLKPIESTIKDVEIIITKATGKSLGLVDIWNKAKSFISGIISLLPAAIVSPSVPGSDPAPAKMPTIPDFLPEQNLDLDSAPDPTPPPSESASEPAPESESLPTYEQEISLEDLQKMLDNLARQIEELTQKLNELVKAESQQPPEEIFYAQGGAPQAQSKNEQTKGDDKEEKEEKKEDPDPDSDPADPENKPSPAPLLTVVINEIAWVGTTANSNHQWIELYNNTDSDIELTGWKIFKSGQEFINISTSTTIIPANDFYLLAASPDATDILADLVYEGFLENSGEKLELISSGGILIDQVSCFEDQQENCLGWFVGDNITKQTMERINPEKPGSHSDNWANNNLITRNGKDINGNSIYGTPKKENSVAQSHTELTQENLDQLFEQFDKITLSYYGSPYISSGLKVPENKILSINSNVVLRFRRAYRKYELGALIIEGTLLADGSQGEIFFTSFYDQDYGGEGFGDRPWEQRWRGIRFYPVSQNSELENVFIKYAGGSLDQEPSRGVMVEDTSIKIKNSIIEDSRTGLYLKNSNSQIESLAIQNNGSYSSILISGGSPLIKNSKFIKNHSGIIVEDGSKAEIIGNYFEEIEYGEGVISVRESFPVLKDNSGANNELNAIRLSGSVLEDWTLYPNNNLFYVISQLVVTVDSILNIEPGVIIKFEPRLFYSGNNENLIINGALKAIGSLSEKIIFTSTDDQGQGNNDSISYWNRIHFTPQAGFSILENAIISYGGRGGPGQSPSRGAVYVERASVIFDKAYFKDNIPGSHTLYLEDSASEIKNSIFENNWIAITIVGQDQNILENNIFENCNCHIMKDNQCILSRE